MKLSRMDRLAAAATLTLSLALVVALVADSLRWSIGLLGALTVFLAAFVVIVLRRSEAGRAADVERIETKVDHVALRVVTEAQATHRELSGLIEQLGADLNRRGPTESG